MAVCDNCGREVPQEDIDAGVAFSDGKNTYCRACVMHLIGELGRLAREAEASTTTCAPKAVPRKHSNKLFLLLLACASAAAAIATIFLL
ncbi:MAG: hypothetical protein DRP82_02420 [Planctomycetota bacterium]|nr:MAG: hypothetical protein DRP82_02420 [Planctomycetota bacterium]